jgi:hypothetical protein
MYVCHGHRRVYAQRPRRAINPAPSIIDPTAYVNFQFDAAIISLLNKNSWANSYKIAFALAIIILLELKPLHNGTHLNQTGVDQDTRTDGVKDTRDDAGSGALRVVRCSYSETDRNTQGSGDAVEDGSSNGHPVIFFGKVHVSQSRANTETLKGF